MTKEKLEKEAKENSFRYTLDKPWACEVERKQIMAHFEKGYLAGAEPREKRIEELEKENAELKSELTKKADTNHSLVEQIADLESENAELKGSLELYENGCCRAENECVIKDQLTQAKEIIKGLLSCCRNYPQENAEKIKQAEQFLRENDIDNAIRQANEGLDLDKIADEVEQDIKEGCPDTLCENCKKEDCTVRKLGLVPNKE